MAHVPQKSYYQPNPRIPQVRIRKELRVTLSLVMQPSVL